MLPRFAIVAAIVIALLDVAATAKYKCNQPKFKDYKEPFTLQPGMVVISKGKGCARLKDDSVNYAPYIWEFIEERTQDERVEFQFKVPDDCKALVAPKDMYAAYCKDHLTDAGDSQFCCVAQAFEKYDQYYIKILNVTDGYKAATHDQKIKASWMPQEEFRLALEFDVTA